MTGGSALPSPSCARSSRCAGLAFAWEPEKETSDASADFRVDLEKRAPSLRLVVARRSGGDGGFDSSPHRGPGAGAGGPAGSRSRGGRGAGAAGGGGRAG